MSPNDPLAHYEATEAQELIQLLHAAKPQADVQVPASFRVKVQSQKARRSTRAWERAWSSLTVSPLWGAALAAGFLLSVGANAWLGTRLWERFAPGSAPRTGVEQARGAVSWNASTFQAGIQSQTPLGALVTASPLEPQGTAFGFAPAAPVSAYRTGLLYADALAALRSGTLEVAAQRLTGLEQALTQAQAPTSLTTYVQTLGVVVARSQATDAGLEALLAPFETVYTEYVTQQEGSQLPLFRLGTWVGTMALAAAAGDTSALHRGNVTGYFLDAMRQRQAPTGLLQALQRLNDLLGRPALTAPETTEVRKLLTTIHSLVG